jgi:hypothetical protein
MRSECHFIHRLHNQHRHRRIVMLQSYRISNRLVALYNHTSLLSYRLLATTSQPNGTSSTCQQVESASASVQTNNHRTTYESVRGTHDRYGLKQQKHAYVTRMAHQVAVKQFGFDEIDTSILQYKHIFHRSLGIDSDVVSKQIFHCTHQGTDDDNNRSNNRSNLNNNSTDDAQVGKQIILRPENTASVMRTYLSELRQQPLPIRVFYQGPMFRFERPQYGRLREVSGNWQTVLNGRSITDSD